MKLCFFYLMIGFEGMLINLDCFSIRLIFVGKYFENRCVLDRMYVLVVRWMLNGRINGS